MAKPIFIASFREDLNHENTVKITNMLKSQLTDYHVIVYASLYLDKTRFEVLNAGEVEETYIQQINDDILKLMKNSQTHG